jgi:hypothetical protein
VAIYHALRKRVLQGWSSAQRKGNVLEAALAAQDALFYLIMSSTGLRALDMLRLLMQGIEQFLLVPGEESLYTPMQAPACVRGGAG